MSLSRENIMPDFCNRQNPFHYTTAIDLLMSKGIDPDSIDILAVGKYENYKGEVRSQEPAPGTVITPDTTIRLEIGFSSAVDIMPYQFFYGLQGRNAGDEWELAARHLMAPFDGAVIRREAIMRYQALKYAFSVVDEEHIRRFFELFDFDLERETGDRDQAILWIALLPTFNEWAGNPVAVEKILSRIFGYRFRIVENMESSYDVPQDMRYYLGSLTGRLGRETVIGSVFTERDSCYGVRIMDIRQEEVANFLPGKPLRRKLDLILSLCMPNNFHYRISFITRGRGTKIGDEKSGAYLGYATRL